VIRVKWELIPEDTDVLITHGPPYGVGDLTAKEDSAGFQDLLEVIMEIKPKLHIFGHIHEGYVMPPTRDTTFINASSTDQLYRLVNPPIVFDY
jgi:Icc-related predicted phosphoesterase